MKADMKSKGIIFTQPCVTQLLEQEVPEPGAGEVQVRLAISTISSGTERANLMGSKTISWNLPEAKEAKFPRQLGYSASGVVEKVGASVTDIKVGDRVALAWCVHSQYQNISAEHVYRIGELPFEDAALFNIATFPLAAIRKCRLEIGESAIVMGMGVLGLAAVRLLRAAGAAPIIAVDPVFEKREKALQCGADYALDPLAPDFAETVKKLTNGGVKVGIEVTGAGAGLNGILDCMARFGRVALLGCTRDKNFTVDYYRKVHGPGITLVGAHDNARPTVDSGNGWWTHKDDMLSLIRLTETGRIRLSDMVDETYSPNQAPEVFDKLVKDKAFPVVQFDWRTL